MEQHSHLIRSLLFVPGNRQERFSKAVSSKADVICFDLEDSIPSLEKATARKTAVSYLETLSEKEHANTALRINPPKSNEGQADLEALENLQTPPPLILLPKVENADDILSTAYALESKHCAFIPLIETPQGIAKARSIVEAHPAIAAIMFGGADYAARLGIPISWEGMLHARQELVFAAALKGIEAIDVPYINDKDHDGLAVEAGRARAIGFQGKAAIHPSQIDVINRAFSPSEEEIQAAKSAIAAFKTQGHGVTGDDGQIIEAPLLARYQRVLDAAHRIQNRD